MKHFILMVAAALLLSACGSGGTGGNAGSSAGGAGGGSTLDAFTSYVAGLVSAAPDNREPDAVDAVTVTTSESKEPSPVM